MNLGIIGTGLIGGSLALALKKNCPEKYHIHCYNRSIQTSITAFEMQAVDNVCDSIGELTELSDVIIIATPISSYKNIVRAIAERFDNKKVISDVGSVKSSIKDEVLSILGKKYEPNYIPCHPIAGKEVGGIENADADLYDGRLNILTIKVENINSSMLREIWLDAGSTNTVMTAENHDITFAKVSHLPQYLSYKLSKFISPSPQLKEFTRLSESPQSVWKDIFEYNHKNIYDTKSQFIKSFDLQVRKYQAGKAATTESEENDDIVFSSLVALAYRNICKEDEMKLAGTGHASFVSILNKNILQKQDHYSKTLDRKILEFTDDLKNSNISRNV